ncbi:MAG: hypothetical protein U0V73_07210 [Acidimicrobiia bacterium]
MAGRGATPPPEDLDVRHVQPYQATKTYRCPGCDHEIAPGVGHEVVVPVDAPDLRRHWHTPCWQREQRRRHGRGPARPPRFG